MQSRYTKLLTAAVVGCSALWAVQGTAAQTDQASQAELQNQIDQLQQQVQTLKEKVNHEDQAKVEEESSGGVSDPLSINGGVVGTYAIKDQASGQKPGGSSGLDYLQLGVSGDLSNGLSYAAQYRWTTGGSIGRDKEFLHFAWGAYNFGANDSSQIKAGYFQTPFGNLPLGYVSFFGNLNYYAGLSDTQNYGVGYKYQNNGWRFDLDYFRDDDISSTDTTYDATPNANKGYDVYNKGNVRLGYTFNHGGDNTLNVSAAFQGSQMETPNRKIGSYLAGTIAAKATLQANPSLPGTWTLLAQVADYKYNVPYNAGINRKVITTSLYGYDYGMGVPASGEVFSASIKRSFNVNWGPIDTFGIYDDYGYLRVDDSSRGGSGYASQGVMENVVGTMFAAGPLYLWTEMVTGRNAQMAFANTKQGEWNTTLKMYAAFYFGGDLVTD